MKIRPSITLMRFLMGIHRNKLTPPPESSRISSILILSYTAIGDTLYATPAIRALKKNLPNAHLLCVLNPLNSELFISNKHIDNYLEYNGKWSRFFHTLLQIKKHQPEIGFILNGNEPQATPLAFFSGCKTIIRIPNINNPFRDFHFNKPTQRNRSLYSSQTRIDQISQIGIIEKSYSLDLFIEPSWYKNIPIKNNITTPIIGLNPCASTVSRMWFIQDWIDLTNKILSSHDQATIIFIGSRADESYNSGVISAISLCADRIIDLSGKITLQQTAALINLFDILVTPDTGPLHIAAATRTPTVAFSVAGKKLSSNPRSNHIKHTFLQAEEICEPCLDKKCKKPICMHQFTSDMIFDEITKIIFLIS